MVLAFLEGLIQVAACWLVGPVADILQWLGHALMVLAAPAQATGHCGCAMSAVRLSTCWNSWPVSVCHV